MIFLSATTPNAIEFSDWIGKTKQKVVHVIKTDYRPVPLSHFLWAGTKLHKVLQGNGSFIDRGYMDATKALLPASASDPTRRKGDQKGRPGIGSKDLAWQAQGNKQNWVSLVRFLDRELMTPAVVFSFSKKKCEELAYCLISLDLNTAKEASAVQGFTIQTIARLTKSDSQLPQVVSICEMVKRGIGVHHGGLLPIMKEMVEILFARGLVKVLFATETFAMGKPFDYRVSSFGISRFHFSCIFRRCQHASENSCFQ
jgi:antiviral helicase SKI2